MSIQFLKKYARTIGLVLGGVGAVTIWSFILLVTSINFHWWQPFWSAETGRVILVTLVILCLFYGLLYAFRFWLAAKKYKKHGYTTYSVIKELIVSTEVLIGFVLCAIWGLLVLANQASVLLVKLLGLVWIMGFVGLVVSQVYELRRKRLGLS